jgi:hypothetical protein
VSDATWERAQEVMARKARSFVRKGDGRILSHRSGANRSRHLHSGLLECARSSVKSLRM